MTEQSDSSPAMSGDDAYVALLVTPSGRARSVTLSLAAAVAGVVVCCLLITFAADVGVYVMVAALPLGSWWLLKQLQTWATPLERAGATAPGRNDMLFCPWGVVIDPRSAEPRALQWAQIKGIALEQRSAISLLAQFLYRRNVMPTYIERLVLLDTQDGGRFEAGVIEPQPIASFADSLEARRSRLVATLAVDWAGERTTGLFNVRPLIASMIEAVRAFLSTDESEGLLGLGPVAGGFRDAASSRYSKNSADRLREALEVVGASPDRRIFAAIVAGELGLRELTPVLARLRDDPHPLMALVARAALVRLGTDCAAPAHAETLARFVLAEDREAAERWEREGVAASSLAA